jgi:hypothetical protein
LSGNVEDRQWRRQQRGITTSYARVVKMRGIVLGSTRLSIMRVHIDPSEADSA